ncbi:MULTISPECIES: tRNA-uridine aminocarboxypropyltransferase [Microbulbifer]|uniref:tRNA-uridine aminocarboxypropyltransferase n=1 Tax=Microbulbifer TaxID=48073 RepID=UPI000747FCCF|nr:MULTISPECIES: tRNA-uridine aminocarboxypropyltransferase [Microbulbifer]KUJ83747.1 hypothetical protein AVO43_07915 [Microbulbifer sp. ZGT114]
MKIYLLTHERELHRPTNTGSVAMAAAGMLVQRIVWERKNPALELQSLAAAGQVALVYPATESGQQTHHVDEFEHFILLDGTWQEARKMFNRTPYLQSAPQVSLKPQSVSTYLLRRNQRDGGLCTAECVVELLHAKGHVDLALALEARFSEFNSR